MSLTDSPDCLFRPEDQALKSLFPSADQSNHPFDDFLDGGLYDLGDADHDAGSPSLQDFFAPDSFENTGLTRVSATATEATPQPWRDGLWCLNSKSNTALVVEKTRKMSRPAQNCVAPSHLLNKETFALRSPQSLSRANTKTCTTSPRAVKTSNIQYDCNAVIRQQTLSPSPAYAYRAAHEKVGAGEDWQHDFQNFHLQMSDHNKYPPPPHIPKSTRHGAALLQANARTIAKNATVGRTPQSPTKYHYPFNHMLRLGDEYTEANNRERSVSKTPLELSASQIEQLQRATYPDIGIEQCVAPIWTTESLHSSDSSYQSHESQYSSESYSQACSNLQAQAWMSPPSNGHLSFMPKTDALVLAAPVPQRLPHQVLNQQEQYVHGLGLDYGQVSTDEIGRAVSHGEALISSAQYRAVTPPPASTTLPLYPPLPPYPLEVFADESPFTTPRRRRFSPSRSPSPSVSPTHLSTFSVHGQRSPTRTDHRQTRRKSIHKPGPIRDTSHHDTQRRARSSSRPPRTPKTPKTPTGAGLGQVDFVNFTPKDSAKLMADVAPSGSSKTRARREQEAKEKRKRLSEAAFQAVRRAGGDVSALEKAIQV